MQSINSVIPETTITLHKNIRFHSDLTFGEKIFLSEIHSLMQKNQSGKILFSRRDLGDFFGVSSQTIINWLRKLEKLNLLEVGVNLDDPEGRHFLKLKKKYYSCIK